MDDVYQAELNFLSRHLSSREARAAEDAFEQDIRKLLLNPDPKRIAATYDLAGLYLCRRVTLLAAWGAKATCELLLGNEQGYESLENMVSFDRSRIPLALEIIERTPGDRSLKEEYRQRFLERKVVCVPSPGHS